jgi:hypothetical protein
MNFNQNLLEDLKTINPQSGHLNLNETYDNILIAEVRYGIQQACQTA